MTFVTIVCVFVVVVTIFFMMDVRKNYIDRIARERKEHDMICKYNIIVHLLMESGYAVDFENMADGTKVLVRENGSMIKINPFSTLEYSREQLSAIANWLEQKEPDMWLATDTEHNKSAKGRSEMSMRVRACLDEYCLKWEDL